MQKLRQASCLSFFIATLVLLPNGTTNAGYLTGFVGNTKGTTNPVSLIGTGNFAVLDRLSGASSPGDMYGTGLPGFDNLAVAGGGSASFDTTARYLYLYQSVVSPTSLTTLVSFGESNASANAVPVSSFEQWNLFLADNAGNISSSNDFGTDGLGFSSTPGANIGVINPHISATGGTASLVGATLTLTPTAFFGVYTMPVSPGGIGRIVGFTTNVPPELRSFTGASDHTGATIPVPVPEPSTLALAGIGAAALLARILRRRKHKGRTTQALSAFFLVASIVAIIAIPASAVSLPFASFSDAPGFTTVFDYARNSATGQFQFGTGSNGVIGTATPVDFSYTDQVTKALHIPLDLVGNQNATLAMSSSTLTAVQPDGTQLLTGLGGLVNSISIIRDTPAVEGTGSKTNLLTITFTGELTGLFDGQNLAFIADADHGNTVTYSSDFMSFSSAIDSFSMFFGELFPELHPAFAAGDPNVTSYTTGLTGKTSFSGLPVGVPEPSSIALACLGLVALLAYRWRRYPFSLSRATAR